MAKKKGDAKGLDKSRPIELRVATRDGVVVIGLGDLQIGMELSTARQFAEEVLKAVGSIDGASYWVMRVGPLSTGEEKDDGRHLDRDR